MIAFDDPVRQEIWATVRALNDAWTKGDPDDLAGYFHEDMIAITPTERGRLDGGAACLAGWKGFSSAVRILGWQEIDPVIRVYGDAAVVAYGYELTYDSGGEAAVLGGRDMMFLVKEDGRWWVVGDQFSGNPG